MKKSILLALILGLTACGNNTSSNPNPTPDASTDASDETVDVAPDVDEDQNPDQTCEAKTTCDPEQCGQVNDGCDGILDCGTCQCTPMTASVETCGICEAGRLTCAQDNAGRGVCDAQDLPAEVPCESYLYVEAGATSGDGSKERPYSSLIEAMDAARVAGQPAVILIAGGTYSESQTLEIVTGVHVFGGYDADTWTYNPDVTTVIDFQLNELNALGVNALDVFSKTIVANININVNVNGGNSVNNYGVRVVNSPGLELESINVVVDDASGGGSGSTGADGADAPAVSKQIHALNQDTSRISQAEFVNTECPSSAGGKGGRGARVETSGQGAALSAEEGQDSVSGRSGGEQGTLGFTDGQDGDDGRTPSMSGQDGTEGVAITQLNAFFFDLSRNYGSTGMDGTSGEGGGGGGGSYWSIGARPEGPNGYAGMAGGDGGSGGCGGKGGGGGEAGGFSVALMIVNTSDLSIEDSSFTAGDGGNGGNGGDGGRGGIGAVGGEAATEYFGFGSVQPRSFYHPGGKGGNGGNGTEGGQGGPGAGGSSYGVFCDASSIAPTGDVTFKAGAVGRAGIFASGARGQDGQSKDNQDCN